VPESIQVSIVLPASAERLYRAWMDSNEHAGFTGSPADIDPVVGRAFSAWDGYISGVTLELQPYRRIVQSWRTTDFPHGSPDSRLEILFTERGAETELRLIHTNIPDGQGAGYEQGWIDYYFTPMQEYFAPEDIA
jgi:uncharacterized protein YndB with AHSA1/START domain